MAIDRDTKQLIHRTRIIVSVFLVGIGALLVYSSTRMDQQNETVSTDLLIEQQAETTTTRDDVFVILKDAMNNVRGFGALIWSDGTVLTNKHVVEWIEEDIVVNYKLEDYLIDYVWLHPYEDYALVRIYDIQTECIALTTEPLTPKQKLTDGRPARSSYAFGPLEAVDATTIQSTQLIVAGMSWTPLITSDGKLAALLQARDELNENQAKVTPITESIQARVAKATSTEKCRRIER